MECDTDIELDYVSTINYWLLFAEYLYIMLRIEK